MNQDEIDRLIYKFVSAWGGSNTEFENDLRVLVAEIIRLFAPSSSAAAPELSSNAPTFTRRAQRMIMLDDSDESSDL
jgi:hypothetical protein